MLPYNSADDSAVTSADIRAGETALSADPGAAAESLQSDPAGATPLDANTKTELDDDKQVYAAVYGMKPAAVNEQAAAKEELYAYIRSFGGTILPNGTVVYRGELTDEEYDKMHGTRAAREPTRTVKPNIATAATTTAATDTSKTPHSSSTRPANHHYTTPISSGQAVDATTKDSAAAISDKPAESFSSSAEFVGRDNNGVKLTRQQITLSESDLAESFTKGGGRGGQKVNKSNNCVLLVHKPTNTYVKCHATRSLVQNRILARKIMMNRLDELYNGNQSRTSVLRAKAIKAKSKQAQRVRLKYGSKGEQADNTAQATPEPADDMVQLEQRLMRHTVVDKNNKSLNKKLAKQLLAINIPNTHQLHTQPLYGTQYNKQCSACRSLLRCNSHDIQHCWCAAVTLDESTSQHLRQQYTDCLCLTCLTSLNIEAGNSAV